MQDIPWKLTLFKIESYKTLTFRNVLVMFSMCSPKNIFVQDIVMFFLERYSTLAQCNLGGKEEKLIIYLQSDIIQKLITNITFNIKITSIIDYKKKI